MYFSFFESVSVYFYISLEPILILCFEFDCIVGKFLCMQDKLTASAVGSIVGMKSDEIQQIASEYEEKVSRWKIYMAWKENDWLSHINWRLERDWKHYYLYLKYNSQHTLLETYINIHVNVTYDFRILVKLLINAWKKIENS